MADRLGKFKHEVEELPVEEFYGWLAYLQLEADAAKKAEREAKRKRS